jgi:hypothetical protein
MRTKLLNCIFIVIFSSILFCWNAHGSSEHTDVVSSSKESTPPRGNQSGDGIILSPDSVVVGGRSPVYRERPSLSNSIPSSLHFPFPEGVGRDENESRPDPIAEFKNYLESTSAFNIDEIKYKIDDLLSADITEKIIGRMIGEIADRFKEHNYFSVNRFQDVSDVSSRTSLELTDADLMRNWRKWYTYKLLSSHYTKEPVTTVDERLSDKKLTYQYDSAQISIDDPNYENSIYAVLKFYEKQLEIKKEIEASLRKEGIDYESLLSGDFSNNASLIN